MIFGIDRIEEFITIFNNKRVGLITNPTGVNSNLKSTIDILREKVNLVALYSPEHGVRADNQAGVRFDSYIDEETLLPVYSLYSKSKRPSKEMLDVIDIMCIDIQDPGSRYYTFIYTMAYAMIECAKYNKEVIVFDRPNPINGVDVEGNILDLEYRSFIGYYPIVQRHGLTIGEIALLFNNEYQINCKLTIIKMQDYDRRKYYDELDKTWIMPSPNLPTIETAILYNATCIFEGTNIEEGRGTTAPFQYVGAPFINPYRLSEKLNSLFLEGVYFRPIYFIPKFSKYPDVLCKGVEVHVTNRKTFSPVKVGWTMFYVIRNMYKNEFNIDKPYKDGMKTMLEYNTGCNYIQNDMYSLSKLYEIIDNDTKKFIEIRKNYLLYKENNND